jgi:hypothetical protein
MTDKLRVSPSTDIGVLRVNLQQISVSLAYLTKRVSDMMDDLITIETKIIKIQAEAKNSSKIAG